MNTASPLLIFLALLTLVGSAQDQTVPCPELDALKQEYDVRVTAADGLHLAAVAELDKKYIARLDQEQKTAQQAGKLDEALAFDGEKKAISSGGEVPVLDDAKTPAVLKKMHAMYRPELAKLTLTRDKNLKPLRNDFNKKLDALVSSLTKNGKLQESMAVRKFRESLPAVSVAASQSGPVSGRSIHWQSLLKTKEKTANVGWGQFEKDVSVKVDGVEYQKAMFAHAESIITYDIKEKGYKRLRGKGGLKDGATVSRVDFQVIGDGKLLWSQVAPDKTTSARITSDFNVDITGVNELKLRVDTLGDFNSDMSYWINPEIGK